MRYCLHIVVLRVVVHLGVLLSPYSLAAGISALGQPMQPGAAKVGTLLVRTDANAPLRAIPMLGTDVDISVTGLVARTVVTQYFHNPTDEWLEGIYVFPLPQNAAVDTLEVRIDDRTIVGEIKERAQAKKIYEQAKAQGRPKQAYFPFSIGPRKCIGDHFAKMESLIILATLLRRFTPSLVPGQRIEAETSITLRPKHGIQMTLSAR